MRKRTIILTCGLLILFFGGLFLTLALLVFHEPNFYRSGEISPGQERKNLNNAFIVRCAEFSNHFKEESGNHPWQVSFTQSQVNSFFMEDVPLQESLQRHGISQVRMAFDSPDRIRLGFRYGTQPLSTILSVEMRVWLVPKEFNVIALEIMGRYAGALPISSQSLLDQISEIARQKNIEVTWYRHQGHPVALLRFQAERTGAPLQHIDVTQPGTLTIRGKTLESLSLLAPRSD